MIDRGEWAVPSGGEPDVLVRGSDADLARAARSHPGGLVAFEPVPGSELARALGLGTARSGAWEVALDALEIGEEWAVNAVVVGIVPTRLRRRYRRRPYTLAVDGRPWFAGRATTVVVAVGQYVDGSDLVPRGHPGDGRAEVQVLALAPGQRRRFRTRLARAEHLPHPDVHQRTGRSAEITGPAGAEVTVDGVRWGALGEGLTVDLVAAAYRLAL